MKPPFSLAKIAAATAVLLCVSAGARAAQTSDADRLIDSAKERVSLELQEIPLRDALAMLSKQFGLSIITARDVNTSVSVRFRNVTLREALDSMVTINGFAYRTRGRVIEVYKPSAAAVIAAPPKAQTFKLKYANAQKLLEVLRPFLSKDVGKMQATEGGNTLIIYDSPDALQTLASVIEKIDEPEPQVTIGAEIIEASISVAEKLGIDWSTRLAVSGAARPMTFPFPDVKPNSSWFPKKDPGSSSSTEGEEGTEGETTDSADFDPGRAFPYATREDFTFGTIDATGLKAVLEVLKSDGGTNLIANPEITTLNNREARINIGDTVPIPIFTTNLETGVSAVTGFEEVETGTILSVIPQVNNDGESVTMTVKPEISEIIGFKGQFDERPITASRRAETTVRLRDGETLVIGGLVNEKSDESITKIPILGDVPLLGWFFKYRSKNRTKRSLYVFVTPRITTHPATYSDRARKAGERLLKNALRVPDTGADDLRNPGTSPFGDRKPGSRVRKIDRKWWQKDPDDPDEAGPPRF
jgi:type IV pilus secretin PilQ/predicted competence protein